MYKQKIEDNEQNKIPKESRGITLIALVITIIVLLILAGVSIATLTGQGNILENAGNTREQTNETTEKEKVDLAVSSAIINAQGNLSKEKLQDAIVNQFGEEKREKLKGEEEGPWVFEGDIKSYNIDKKGTVLAHVPASKVNALIGQTVDSYTEDSNKVNDWRVFYTSDTELFLISSNTINSKTAFEGDTTGIPLRKKGATDDYTGAIDVFNTSYGSIYNKLWKETGSEDKECRSKAAAYLCDKDNWTEYVGSNVPDGTYAVGGPTKELLIRSWVASGQIEGKKEDNLKALLEDTIVSDSGTGYTWNKPSLLYVNNPIKNTILPNPKNKNEGLYHDGWSYWLASPSSIGIASVCDVGMNGEISHYGYNSSEVGVRPLVSIPISNVRIEDGTIKIGNN